MVVSNQVGKQLEAVNNLEVVSTQEVVDNQGAAGIQGAVHSPWEELVGNLVVARSLVAADSPSMAASIPRPRDNQLACPSVERLKGPFLASFKAVVLSMMEHILSKSYIWLVNHQFLQYRACRFVLVVDSKPVPHSIVDAQRRELDHSHAHLI